MSRRHDDAVAGPAPPVALVGPAVAAAPVGLCDELAAAATFTLVLALPMLNPAADINVNVRATEPMISRNFSSCQ